MKNIKELKKHILSNINPNWSTLEKVRFVYVESGKYLQKHTEFFLTVDDKLTETKLNPKKLDRIYMGRLNSDEWNKMICKTGAEFIKDVLNILGIESQLVETVKYTKIKGMKHHLHHYFLCVNVGGYNIFLTPAADYANIQNGFCTLRFGSEISYLVDGEQFYKANFEIPHRTLTRKDVKELDDKIGFTIKTVKDTKNGEVIETGYLDELIKREKGLYDEFLAIRTEFYNGIMPENDDDKPIKSISDRRNNWNDIINYVCSNVGKRLSTITGKEYSFDEYVNRNNFNDWVKYINDNFNIENNKDYYYQNTALLFNKAKAFCYSIINFCNRDAKEDDKEEILQFRNKYVKQLIDLSKHFINPKYVIEPKDKNKYISNAYINHKISTFLPYVLNANNNFIEPLNNQGYSEQIEFIKKTIELMFSELGKKNILKKDDPDFKYPPIYKRVNLFTYRNKKRDEYGTYIAITEDEDDKKSIYWYKYNLRDNIFERTSLAKIAIESAKTGKYEIISNRLKNVLNNIEVIENAGNTGTLRLVVK